LLLVYSVSESGTAQQLGAARCRPVQASLLNGSSVYSCLVSFTSIPLPYVRRLRLPRDRFIIGNLSCFNLLTQVHHSLCQQVAYEFAIKHSPHLLTCCTCMRGEKLVTHQESSTPTFALPSIVTGINHYTLSHFNSRSQLILEKAKMLFSDARNDVPMAQ
jgi:hypothetical protein